MFKKIGFLGLLLCLGVTLTISGAQGTLVLKTHKATYSPKQLEAIEAALKDIPAESLHVTIRAPGKKAVTFGKADLKGIKNVYVYADPKLFVKAPHPNQIIIYHPEVGGGTEIISTVGDYISTIIHSNISVEDARVKKVLKLLDEGVVK